MHSPYRRGVMKAASDGSAFRFTETFGRCTSPTLGAVSSYAVTPAFATALQFCHVSD
jgi:hypothetical protein